MSEAPWGTACRAAGAAHRRAGMCPGAVGLMEMKSIRSTLALPLLDHGLAPLIIYSGEPLPSKEWLFNFQLRLIYGVSEATELSESDWMAVLTGSRRNVVSITGRALDGR